MKENEVDLTLGDLCHVVTGNSLVTQGSGHKFYTWTSSTHPV